MGPGDLSHALAPLARKADPRILVGHETFDDAGVFRVSDDVAIVQTVDFFAPIVDDPYDFGQVAAANALSDIYAMGGTPLTAMNIAAFPTDKLPLEVLTEILRGGQDKVHEAGAHVIGGHTIVDDEIKFGLSVTGRIDPRAMLTNAGARPGDRLVLTKPLGNGILATALKQGTLDASTALAMIALMRELNAAPSRAALDVGSRCATDITGFGLLGHASHIARASGVTLAIRIADVPIIPGARDAWLAGSRPGGGSRNLDYVTTLVAWGSAGDAERALLTDPQTSGGLLVAVPPARVADYLARVPRAAEVGEVLPKAEAAIVLG
jgi:selenide, water dikinase